MTTPTEGVNEPSILSEDDAANALLAQWTDAEDQPSAPNEGEPAANTPPAADPVADEGDEDEATMLALAADEDEAGEDEDPADQTDQSEDDNEDPQVAEATDDHTVSITVDGEVQTVTVGALKRLFGQEASLTRKSQEVAAARKAADAESERYMIAAQKMLSRAEDRFAPFAKIDWMVAQNKLAPDEFAALREEARSAYQDLEFLKAETDDVLSQVQSERQTQLAETAKEAIATLERDIPGWNREVYDQVRAHAVETGMAPEAVNTIVDPAALKLMHDAMRYRELKARAAAKKTTKPAAPKRVVKPTAKTPGNMGSKTKAESALTRLATTGTEDDAVAALLAGWESNPA